MTTPPGKGAEWDEYQNKIIKDWINTHLAIQGIQVTELEKDICDGEILNKMIDYVLPPSKEDRKVGNRKSLSFDGKITQFKSFMTQHSPAANNGSSAFRQMRQRDNVTKALEKLKDIGIDPGVQVDAILSGNLKSIMAVLWKIIRYAEDHPSIKKNTEVLSTEESKEPQEEKKTGRNPCRQ